MGEIFEKVRLVGSRGEVEVKALFDSGATYSFVRRDVAERVANIEALPEPMRFATANPDAPVEACERIVCNFYIDGVRYSDEFLVLERISEELIIGASTMQKWGIRLDLENEKPILTRRDYKLRLLWLQQQSRHLP